MTTLLSISFGLRAVLTQIYFSVWKLWHGKTILGNPSILPFLALHEAYRLTTIAILGVYAHLQQQIRLSFLIVHQFHWKNQSKKKKQNAPWLRSLSGRYRFSKVSGSQWGNLPSTVRMCWKKDLKWKNNFELFCSWYIWIIWYANRKPIDLCAWGEALLEVSCKIWRHTDACTSPWHYAFSKVLFVTLVHGQQGNQGMPAKAHFYAQDTEYRSLSSLVLEGNGSCENVEANEGSKLYLP